MGVHSSLRGGYIASLPISSYEDDSLSLEFDSLSYMDILPCFPPSFGHLLDWLVGSTFIKDFSTYEKTSDATSIAYYIWIPHPSSYPQWEVYLHLYLLYLLPKGRNVVVGIGYFFVFMTSLWEIIQYGGIPSYIFSHGGYMLVHA